jgi:hypothetical protein
MAARTPKNFSLLLQRQMIPWANEPFEQGLGNYLRLNFSCDGSREK